MPSAPSVEERELIAFIERDYAITQEAAGSAESAVVASRSVGFTLMAGLLGVGLSQKSWVIVALAAVSGAASYLIDGYFSWRSQERGQYLRGLERVLAANYAVIERAPNNPFELNVLATRLAAVRVGANTQIRRFRYRDVFYNEPYTLFRALYPVLIVAALVAAVYLGIDALNVSQEGAPLSRCKDGVRVTLTSPLRVEVPRGARSQTFELTVPAARVECG